MAWSAALIARGLTPRSEEHTSELQSRFDLVCRLLLEKKKRSPENSVHIFVELRLLRSAFGVLRLHDTYYAPTKLWNTDLNLVHSFGDFVLHRPTKLAP